MGGKRENTEDNQVHLLKKQHLKCADEIVQDIADDDDSTVLGKSTTSPASLQTVVRIQNGSSMAVQHKVSNLFCLNIKLLAVPWTQTLNTWAFSIDLESFQIA